jgi:hypothetical protein
MYRRVRARSVRLLSVLLALGLLSFPGLGIVELAAAIFGLPGQDDLVSTRSGYGLVIGLLLPVALLALVRKPILAAAPAQHVFTVALPRCCRRRHDLVGARRRYRAFSSRPWCWRDSLPVLCTFGR